ncbi:fatty acid desaturase [Trinickia mobilis]|uniref:fatty acid desaturase n=1 Tax=Trinickia mobilis TaxID=2816356 RepID=UPI001A8FA3FC|nr:fatty acid desaturase [Trinickia mobilis]
MSDVVLLYRDANPAQAPEGDLKHDVELSLAFVSGKDLRQSLPPEVFVRKPLHFITKFLIALLIIAGATALVTLTRNYVLIAIAVLVNGLMFAHLIELQHECMHGHAFRSPALNRLCGVICGIFIASSNAHYRYDHMRHHAWLGTSRNLEHFNYRFSNLNSVIGFTRTFFDLSRYKRVARILWRTLLGKTLPGVDKAKASREIKQEYMLYLLLFLASVGAAIASQTPPWRTDVQRREVAQTDRGSHRRRAVIPVAL